jgi:hypothetical protein
MRRVIYTAIIGDIDILKPPGAVPAGWECDCFSDRPRQCPGWETVVVPPDRQFPDPRRASRRMKILSHDYLPDADIAFWMHANMTIACDLDRVVDVHLARHNVALFQHPAHDCVYQEAEAVVAWRKDDPEVVHRQMARYRREGYPEHHGMVACCILLRRHTEAVRRFNELWWQELASGSLRDQLSFNYVADRVGLGYSVIEKAYAESKNFVLRPHGM